MSYTDTTTTDLTINFMDLATYNGLSQPSNTSLWAVKMNEECAKWAMPSSQAVTLTLGASGSTLVAPSHGWITLSGYASAIPASLEMSVYFTETVGCHTSTYANTSSQVMMVTLPVQKGMTVSYSYTNFSSNEFKFIYAEGALE